MTKPISSITFSLPDWLSTYTQSVSFISSLEERMAFVIEASRKNIEYGTGGPFAAAVFNKDTGKLLSLGVNCVVSQGLSMLHAEMVAIAFAQQSTGQYDLSLNRDEYELVTSTEPCAMCFGGIQWAGLKRVVSGATDEDARKIGFDEGAKVGDWKKALEIRGIEVISEVNRPAAALVLNTYLKLGGNIYNPVSNQPL